MRKTITIASAAALAVGLLAGPASAELSEAQQGRKAACETLDPGPGVTATYAAGQNPAQDRCTVVSTATTYEESVEQVNNPRAAKAVVRVQRTETKTTTTQAYRWQVGQTKWVAHDEPVTEEEQTILDECMRTPGNDKCA